MYQSHAFRWIAGVLGFLAILSVLRYKPWLAYSPNKSRQELKVGFLPVT